MGSNVAEKKAEDPDSTASVYADLAEVALLRNDRPSAREALEGSLALAESKGNVVMAADMRRRISALT